MAMNRNLGSFDRHEVKELGDMAKMRPADAIEIVEEEGIDGLRVQVAARLYATIPMSTGEAADKVGLRNRGLLVQYILDHHIQPAEGNPTDPEAAQAELRRRMDERLARWRS